MTRLTNRIGPYAILPLWIIELPIAHLSVRLYGRLAIYANKDGQAWPSRSTLADDLNVSVDSIDRALRELLQHNAIHAEKRYDDGGAPISSMYTIEVAAPMLVGEPHTRGQGSRTDAARVAAGGSRMVAAQSRSNDPDPIEPDPMNQDDNGSDNDQAIRRLLDHWANVVGTTLPRLPADQMESYLERNMPESWIADAITLTAGNGVKQFRYTLAILDRWEREGREEKKPAPSPTTGVPSNRVEEPTWDFIGADHGDVRTSPARSGVGGAHPGGRDGEPDGRSRPPGHDQVRRLLP